MKIKYNNLFMITPIFFTIALFMSYLDYKDELKELDWGIKSKAEAIAIPSKIFIEHMLQNKTLDEIAPELKEKFAKVIKHKQATRMYISKKSRILLDTNDNIYKLVIVHKLKGPRITKPFVQNNLKLVTIHVPVESKENLILSVDVDVTSFYMEKEVSFIEMIYMLVLATFLGIITSWILSRIVTSKIYELNADATAIASGNYSHNSYLENIKEFTDLGDTLNIMKSIMNEIISKAKNTMLQEEKSQNDNDLINTFKYISDTNEIESIKNIDLCIKPIGKESAEYFHKAFIHNNKIYAFIGKVTIENSTISTLMNASSVQTYITEYLKQDSFDLKKLIEIFDIEFLELLCIDEKGIVQSSKFVEQEIIEDVDSIDNNIVTFKCMNNNSIAKNKLDIYLANYENLTLSTLINDLDSILDDKESELLIIYQKTP